MIRGIRAGGPRGPVIFLTARDSVHERVTGLTLGGDDYVTKPFSLDEVLARIRAVLRRSRGEPEAGSGTTQPPAPLRCPGGEDPPPEASEAPGRAPAREADKRW